MDGRDARSTLRPAGATESPSGRRLARFAAKVAVAAGILILLAALWLLRDLLLLVFAAVLLAVLLRAAAAPIERARMLGEKTAVLVVLVLIVAVLAAFGVLVGRQIYIQGSELLARTPEMLQALGDRIGVARLDERVQAEVARFAEEGGLFRATAGWSMLVVGGIGSTFLVVAGGVYFALQPRLHRRGILALFPPSARPSAGETLSALGQSLRLWLLGQLVAMTLVGVMTTLGLWLLGVKSAFALGFFSGLMDFVPIVGPIVGAVPAVAVAASDSTQSAAWVVALYVLVQQIEGYLISPIVMKAALDLPPALTLFAIVAFGTLFGPLGVLLAAPLTVVAHVLVERLWVEPVAEGGADRVPASGP